MNLTKKKAALSALVLIAMIATASAAILEYYGQIQTTVNVKQAVLLDGKDYTEMPITETVNVAGGESFCRYHWLKSQTSVPVTLTIETNIEPNPDGVTVEYCKCGELLLGSLDFNYRDPDVKYVKGVKLSITEGVAIWIIDLNGSLISGHWSTGAQLLVKTPSKTYTFGISPGAPSQPVYKEFVHGAWSSPLPVPSGMEAVGTVNDEHFELKIPLDYLCEAKWSINIEASWAGHSGSYWARYPMTWSGWYDFTNLTSLPLEPLTIPFALEAGERLDFVICYKFNLLAVGTYTIISTVKPSS